MADAGAGFDRPVYIEKPLARNLEESQRIADAFAAAGVPLYVAYYRRGQPRFIKCKEIIEATPPRTPVWPDEACDLLPRASWAP